MRNVKKLQVGVNGGMNVISKTVHNFDAYKRSKGLCKRGKCLIGNLCGAQPKFAYGRHPHV